MKKSELRQIIRGIIREQGPDPIEPYPDYLDPYPGGIPTPSQPTGAAVPNKGIENPEANRCCGPLKKAIDYHAKFIVDPGLIHDTVNHIENTINPTGTNVTNELAQIMQAAKTAGDLHMEMQKMFDKCCQGKVDTSVTMTTPTTYGDKFTGGGGNMIAPVKGIQPAQDAIISERLQKLANIK